MVFSARLIAILLVFFALADRAIAQSRRSADILRSQSRAEADIRDRVNAWTAVAAESDVVLAHEGTPDILVRAVPGALEQILDNTVVNVALPTLERFFKVDLHQIQWVVTGYMLAQAAVIPLSGWLTRRRA